MDDMFDKLNPDQLKELSDHLLQLREFKTTKTCKKCLKEKSLDKFYKRSQSKDGRHKKCIECMKKNSQRLRDNKKLEREILALSIDKLNNRLKIELNNDELYKHIILLTSFKSWDNFVKAAELAPKWYIEELVKLMEFKL